MSFLAPQHNTVLLTRRASTVLQTVCRALQQDVRLAIINIKCSQIKHVQLRVAVISIVMQTKFARTVTLIAVPAPLQQVAQLVQLGMNSFRVLVTRRAKVISIAIPQHLSAKV